MHGLLPRINLTAQSSPLTHWALLGFTSVHTPLSHFGRTSQTLAGHQNTRQPSGLTWHVASCCWIHAAVAGWYPQVGQQSSPYFQEPQSSSSRQLTSIGARSILVWDELQTPSTQSPRPYFSVHSCLVSHSFFGSAGRSAGALTSCSTASAALGFGVGSGVLLG